MAKKRALISVSDKNNLIDFSKELISLDYELISTGGTANFLRENNIAVKEVQDITGFPECFDGRVKTLHPKIHGGLLARRDLEDHLQSALELEIPLIDLLVVNLYPFEETVLQEGTDLADCIEQIDIGGPAMLRSAAKNYNSVAAIIDSEDYLPIINELKNYGDISLKTKMILAAKVFSMTAFYDSLIAQYLTKNLMKIESKESLSQSESEVKLSSDLILAYHKVSDLRYGENPSQKAALYDRAIPVQAGLNSAKQLHGKELSYNNYSDTDAALSMIKEFERPTVVAVKHGNPCGIASADTIEEAWQKAYQADPVSIFGGIIVQNKTVTIPEAKAMSKVFLEVILAPDFEEEALQILSQKKNIRLLVLPNLSDPYPSNSQMIKDIYGGILIQDYDQSIIEEEQYQIITKAQPDQNDLIDYYFAMKVAKHVKSNAIVLVKNEQTVGIGPGQPNRITSAKIAIEQAGDKSENSILASDAFFPFSDTVEAAYRAGIKGIIQPGGSIRDQESIDFCNKHGIPMIFTGVRHFKH